MAVPAVTEQLREMIARSAHLTMLKLDFYFFKSFPMDFLVPLRGLPVTSTLHTLSIMGVAMSPAPLLKLISLHKKTLRRLHVQTHILDSHTHPFHDWREFFERLRDGFGKTLTKVQFCGKMDFHTPANETWRLLPCYDDWWWEKSLFRGNRRTKELEDFVIRGAQWPASPPWEAFYCDRAVFFSFNTRIECLLYSAGSYNFQISRCGKGSECGDERERCNYTPITTVQNSNFEHIWASFGQLEQKKSKILRYSIKEQKSHNTLEVLT